MMRFVLALLFVASIVVTGCQPQGQTSSNRPDPAPGKEATAEGKKYLLTQEPVSPKDVAQTRKQAKDGDEVIVVGKVGGSAKPFTQGRASFLIADAHLPVEETCDCPWDFCEVPEKQLQESVLFVKFVDDQGRTLRTGAREMFAIKELSTVVVKGKVSRDNEGNLSLLATGLFISKP
jgi:hypothetical protein